MKALLITFILLISFPWEVFGAGTLVIEAVGVSAIYGDYSSSELLQKGCLVQVILDREGDGLDTIEYSGNIYPAGDDILLPVLSGSSTFGIGDGLPPFNQEGQFSIIVSLDNEDPFPNYSGYRIYVRFWNSPSPGVGSMYGEAGPFILESGLKPQVINIVKEYDLFTDKVLGEE